MDKRSLNADYLRETIMRLAARVGARFPKRNLAMIAAELCEHTTGSTVLDTIEGIETLTTGMSRKIWQKIALLPQNRGQATPRPS